MIPIDDDLIEFRMGKILMRFPMVEIRLAKESIDHVLEAKLIEEREAMKRSQMQP